MAISYSHKLGQIIGDSLEIAVAPFLRSFADQFGLYLDKKGERKARTGKKVTWLDIHDNAHDLDFVLEKGGTEESIGIPVAFIECAWRRYTKHSRNKAQEIQGAIIPLCERYKMHHPFIGVILAGVFTQHSINQLTSLGFSILFFPYEKIIDAFAGVGMDVRYDEKTEESFFAQEIGKWNGLTKRRKDKVYRTIAGQSQQEILSFIASLEQKITRKISRIRLWTMFGKQFVFTSLDETEKFIREFDPAVAVPEFCRYEAKIEYTNGDMIELHFADKKDFLTHLKKYKET